MPDGRRCNDLKVPHATETAKRNGTEEDEDATWRNITKESIVSNRVRGETAVPW